MMYAISKQVYTDNEYVYKNILTINAIPQGPLANYTRCLNLAYNRVSAFQTRANAAQTPVYALYNDAHELFTLAQLPEFFTFCQTHNYTIEKELTQMLNSQASQLNSVICYISYTP
jgi:hypothetical protein